LVAFNTPLLFFFLAVISVKTDYSYRFIVVMLDKSQSATIDKFLS